MPEPSTTTDGTAAPPEGAGSAGAPDAPVVDRGDHRRQLRRTYRRRRMIALVATAAVVVTLAAVGYVAFLRPDDGTVRAGGPDRSSLSSTGRSSSTTTTSTTTTTTTPTTTTPPTTVPVIGAPVVAPVPGITVGPLTEGPGPIPVVHRIPTFDPVVFITIDDGVTPDQGALAVLRARQVPTTLFLTQQFVPKNADYFKALQPTGAAIESHSIIHQSLRGKDEATQRREICEPSAQYAQLFGTTPELFRPPYGNWDDTTVRVAASCGMRAVVHWSATFDGGRLTTTGGPLRAGDIILLHFKPGLGLNLAALLNQIAAAGLRPAQLLDYIRSAPPAPAPVAGAPATTAPAAPAEPSPLPQAAPPAG